MKRRSAAVNSDNGAGSIQLLIRDYAFDYSRQELSWNSEIWRMTEKENEVLRRLCMHQDKILRRDDAVEKIYGKKDKKKEGHVDEQKRGEEQ